MKYSTKKDIDPEQLDVLWRTIGWKPRGPEKWKEVLSKSSFVYSIWDRKDRNLIGFGRILEDGIMCMIYDVGVHPAFRYEGLGTKIMEALIEQVRDKGYASIGLFTDEKNPESVEFYKNFGFEQVDTGMELVKHMERE